MSGRKQGLAVGVVAASAVAFATVVVPAVGSTSKVVIPVQADTYVSSSSPATSYDTASSLYVSSSKSNTRMAYLQFVVPSGYSVTKATLLLTRDSHHLPSTTLSVAQSTGAWPAALLYANRPAVGQAVRTVSVDRSQTTVRLNVSSVVTGPGVYAFRISSPYDGNALRFLSRDSNSTKSPGLELQTGPAVVPITSPTATGSAAPTATVSPTPVKASPTATATATATAPVTSTSAPTSGGVAPASGTCTANAMLVPSCGMWFGAAPSAMTSVPRAEAMTDFENRLGEAVDIAHAYHVNGSLFPNALERSWADDPVHPRILMINWKPEFGKTWAQVADGAVDTQIDTEAAYIKANFATKKFFLAVHHEPENEVNPAAGSGMTAKDYAAMYRHVVLRLRADGVTNAVTVMNYMGAPKWGTATWFGDLYPGDDVVDWLGYDPYATAAPGFQSGGFTAMMNRGANASWPGMYNWLTANHPGKPIMLAEWGVAEDTSDPSIKADFFKDVDSELGNYPALKAMIYFDAPQAPVGDTRTNSSSVSQPMFNDMVDQPVFSATVVSP